MTKEERLARHGVVNGTSQPEIFNDIHGTMAPSEASDRTHELPIEPVDEANGHATLQATADPLAPPHIVLREAEHHLDLARAHARECRQATLASREAFGKALAAWNASGPAPQTQEQLMKEHIASNQAERAKRYAAGQGVHYPGLAARPRRWPGATQRMVAELPTAEGPTPARKP